jgi:hypothetical protein
VSTKPDDVETPGKPASPPPPPKPAGPAVIRRTEVAEEDAGQRVMNRHVPAWVISGAVHVVVIGLAVLFLNNPDEVEAKTSDLVTTNVEEPKEDEQNLTNDEVGFDADLPAATDSKIEGQENVVAPDDPKESAGLPDQPYETAPQTAVVGVGDIGAGVDAAPSDNPSGVAQGLDGGGGAFSTPGMAGRSGRTKDAMLKAGGGNTESEAAVARGLAWLARMQQKDGSWKFDGSSSDQVAATGMALLPFLAAGETHKGNGKDNKYKKTVENGINWLLGKLSSATGAFAGASNMYSHAIATVALCECAGMTRDHKVKAEATKAVNYIIRAQAKNGSWGYKAESEGDTSIVGWQIQALASARLAEIKFERDKAYRDAEKFLISVSVDSESKYGYREKGQSQTLTPVALLARYYMGWTPRHPSYARGVDWLVNIAPPNKGNFDMYYYYYATQVMHFYEGPTWHKVWNPKMRDMLISMQHKAGDQAKLGSWDKDGSHIGASCGRLGTTCLALLTLEVYYRHLPLYKRDNGGLAELER